MLRRMFLTLALLLFADPATAQIHFINPFGAPQGSVSHLVTASAPPDYPCAAPPIGSNGFVPREGTKWAALPGDALGMNNGMTWNPQTPYAICLGTQNDFFKDELHDTVWDHGQSDPSTKRRAEMETASKFMNRVDSWLRFEFTTHVDNLGPGFSVRNFQVHWPSGSSPAVGGSEKYGNGGLRFVISTQSDGTSSITRANVPLTQDTVHSFVAHFELASPGFLDAWLDGKQIVHYVGPLGTVKQDGYRLRWGNYGVLNGARVVTKYRNISTPMSATTNMTGYITAPPAW